MSRSKKKGPYVSYNLLKKISKLTESNSNVVIKTWSRSSTILPEMIGHTVAVYNGHKHLPVFINDQLIGHKLGEFVPTRTYRSHVKVKKKGKK